MTITELSIKRPSLIIVVFAALIALGLFSYSKLKYELLPKFSAPIITITTIYPGASPNEVETGITKVIEDAVAGMDKVSEVRSSSLEGVSFVIVELLQSAKTDISLQDAQRKVNEIINKLPSDAKQPVISKFALDELPILRMGVTSEIDSRSLYQFVKDKIQPQLSRIPGVGQVALVGGDQREIKVNLDLQKIKSYNLSIMQVTQSIKASNLDFPTGKIKDRDGQFIVRIAGKLSSVEDLKNLPVGISRQGGIVKLSEVADVEDGIKEYSNVLRLNFRNTIGIIIQKQADANAVEVTGLIKKELKLIEDQYSSEKLKFEIAADGSLFTIDAANAVKEDLAIAVVLVAIVMLMFLHSFRNSIIVMIAIPTSLISTFIAIYALDFSLNLMTLLGLSLVVGILVDDSIVVLENIYHYLEKGVDRKIAALKGRNEIGFAALAITFVDVSVFLPLALVGGIVGNILRQFSVVIVISTLMSLFISFTLTPLLASRFGKLERLTNATLLGKFALWFEKAFHDFTENYILLLKWGFNNRGKIWIITLFMFVASIALAPLGLIGFEFMSPVDRGEFTVNVELAPGTTIEKTNRISQQVEGTISKIADVEKIYTNVGSSSEGLVGFSTPNNSEITVTLLGKGIRKRSTQEIKDDIKSQLAKIPGTKVRVNDVGIFGTSNETPIQILLSGTNNDELIETAKEVSKIVKLIPGTADVRLSSESGNPETKIQIDRNKLLNFGLTLAEVGATLRIALTGDDESKLREGDTEYDIRIFLDQFDRARTDELGNISFTNRIGQQIYLKQFADISRSTGPTKLSRQARSPSIIIYSQAIGRPSGSIAQEFENEMKNFKLPKGVTYSFIGMVKNQKESFSDMLLALFAGILFTYMIMVMLYDSFVYPFIILFSIPLAMIGALFALALTMKSLTIFSMLGVIMLVGLVGKNAILLVDRTNSRRALGESLTEALIDAGRMRIRPIFMTTLTMIFGMLPIALSVSEGAEWKSGLAWALIGGLTSSLFLTLIVVPLVYTKVEEVVVGFMPFVKKITSKLSIKKSDPISE
ncbi:MAG: acriflavin resistance protein [Ignavibacteriales bacterium CG_4_9_14_3_um_filter_34_10]|nr:MAG: acriflavin resistance protein [Ignavibacteriales bacterium CG_4_9_14_3_um_filter_34_10]